MTRYIGKFTLVIAGLVVLLTTVQLAHARQQKKHQQLGIGIFSGGMAAPHLVGWKSVQKELNLTEDQRAKLTEISDKFRYERRLLLHSSSVDFPTMNAQLRELTTSSTAKVNALLDDAQKKRLQEIRVYGNGVKTLFEPDIAETLKITKEQQSEMEKVRAAYLQSLGDLREETRGMTNEELRTKMREIRHEVSEKMLAVLSDEQRAAFEKMKVGLPKPTGSN